jgi:hypothetical protein
LNSNPKRQTALYLILVWMAINAVFMILELTIFGDSADLNNSIELVLWASSIAGLALAQKWGVALSTFTLIYTLSTSMGNIIYYSLWVVNAPRVVINAVLILYLFRKIFEGKSNLDYPQLPN